MKSLPTISIVINTDGRCQALANTLDSLRYIDYPSFEVCVVHGPTEDGTRELLAKLSEEIKIAVCPERNLSMSRNIGIALAAGEIVAFIDDDALPEPEWLRDLAAVYNDPRVGGAGGFVYDHTGVGFQYRLATANRMGRADLEWTRPAPELCFPLTANFPHLLGTNSSFRRKALLSVGCFDEEYEYYLDETDLCCRLVDKGWLIVQVEGAYVHHKFLPSSLRNERRVVRHWYPIIKNKIYFSLRSTHGHHGVQEAIDDARTFINQFARDIEWAISQGYLTVSDRDRFWKDVDRAWREGLTRGLTGLPQTITQTTVQRYATAFVPFPIRLPEGGRRTFCFLSREYPPGQVGGIGRYMHQLARSVAALGHHVHVLTDGIGHDRVDFEDSVWVHRIVPRSFAVPELLDGIRIPQRIWDHSATMLAEVNAIAKHRTVDCVYAPIWDCEGAAVLLDGRFPLVTSLHTTLYFWLSSQPHLKSDRNFMECFAKPMLALEKRLLSESASVQANSEAIVGEISAAYGIDLRSPRVVIIPHGMEDWAELTRISPRLLRKGSLRMLFVGRLEARKGIDVLLAVVRRLMPVFAHVHLDIVGNDSILEPDGKTLRKSFEADQSTAAIVDRITFHGEVDDPTLRGLYDACDIFVAPSRFESFGLIFVEAMMFKKPVVGCRAGGMVEVIDDEVTGLLAEPGDPASLESCLRHLIENTELRERLGVNGRIRYEERFTASRMASDLATLLCRVAADAGDAKKATDLGERWRDS